MILIPTLITSTAIVFLAVVYVCFRRKIVESMYNFSDWKWFVSFMNFFFYQIKNLKDMTCSPSPRVAGKLQNKCKEGKGRLKNFSFIRAKLREMYKIYWGRGARIFWNHFWSVLCPFSQSWFRFFQNNLGSFNKLTISKTESPLPNLNLFQCCI